MKAWRRRKNDNKGNKSAAGDLDAARVRFFTNIVDELQSPLSVILDQIDSALVEADADARARQLRTAQRNARRLERLAGQTADLTRLVGGTYESRLRQVELVPFVESLAMSFEDLADRNGLLLEFFAKKAAVRAHVDPDALTTIVSNLVSNAIKYTPAGGRVGVALDFEPPDLMRISVVDSGIGIPADKQRNLFEPFLRNAAGDARSADGPGIGLPLAYALARVRGGDITVRSETGKGSRFDIVIPTGADFGEPGEALLSSGADRPDVTAEVLFRSTVQALPEATDHVRDLILIVDANEEFRRWAAATLAEVANVETEAGADAAVELAREALPDLVIAADLEARSDGIGLAQHLRADARTSHVPIVLVGAGTDTARRVRAFEAGADDYLYKPIEARELRARASGILDRFKALQTRFREQVVIAPAEVSQRSVDQRFLEKVTAAIENSIDASDFSVQDLGDAVAMSTSQLTRKLQALIGQSPARLIRRMRLQRAADLVAGNAGRISDICFEVGFSDQSHFSRSFKRQFGMAPMEYRRRHGGVTGA